MDKYFIHGWYEIVKVKDCISAPEKGVNRIPNFGVCNSCFSGVESLSDAEGQTDARGVVEGFARISKKVQVKSKRASRRVITAHGSMENRFHGLFWEWICSYTGSLQSVEERLVWMSKMVPHIVCELNAKSRIGCSCQFTHLRRVLLIRRLISYRSVFCIQHQSILIHAH